MKVAIDFDDVIVRTCEEWCKLANKMNTQGAHFTVGDFSSWDLSKATGLGEDVVYKLFGEIDYDWVEPFHNAVDYILEMAEIIDVEVVTGNPRYDAIRKWMDSNRLGDIPLMSTPEKIAYIATTDFDVIVDDKPETLERAVNIGIRAIRFERPWNENMVGWGSSFEYSESDWYHVSCLIRNWEHWERVKPKAKTPWIEPIITNDQGVPCRMTGMYDEILEPIPPEQRYTGPMGTTPPEEPVITNDKGAKQTDLRARYDLLPARAIAAVAGVLHRGEQKYGKDNWRGLSVAEINNHVLGHLVDYLVTGELENLEHAATRALMALEVALVGGGTEDD